MIAATSVLQQQASDIRMQKINWQSYNQSQMISNEDYQCISTLDSEKKAQYLKDQSFQSAKTFLNLLSHVSKDTTIQYLLVMIDDLLTVSSSPCKHPEADIQLSFRRITVESKFSSTTLQSARRMSGDHSSPSSTVQTVSSSTCRREFSPSWLAGGMTRCQSLISTSTCNG